MNDEEFNSKFDEGESMIDDLDLSKALRSEQQLTRISIDFPVWMINSLDKEANRLGVTRQSIIKMWLADKLERRAS